MKKGKIKRLTAAAAVCVLCVASAASGILAVTRIPEIRGIQTYAGGTVTLNTEIDGQAYRAGITGLTENFFDPNHGYDKGGYDVMIPGSTRTGNITFKNNGEFNINVAMIAESTPWETPTAYDDQGNVTETVNKYAVYKTKNSSVEYTAEQLKAASDLLVNNYLEIEIKDPASKTVYKGKLNGKGDDNGSGGRYYMDGENGIINMGTLSPNQSKTYTFTLKIPESLMSVALDGTPEKTAGLTKGYENTAAMIDWHFLIAYSAAPSIDPQPDPSQPTTTHKPQPISPGTGEPVNLYAIASAACGISALAILFIVFRARRGEKGKKSKKDEK